MFAWIQFFFWFKKNHRKATLSQLRKRHCWPESSISLELIIFTTALSSTTIRNMSRSSKIHPTLLWMAWAMQSVYQVKNFWIGNVITSWTKSNVSAPSWTHKNGDWRMLWISLTVNTCGKWRKLLSERVLVSGMPLLRVLDIMKKTHSTIAVCHWNVV